MPQKAQSFSRQKYYHAKFDQLVVYLTNRFRYDVNFGKTKLNCALFFADMHTYRALGSAITGATYVHRKHSPITYHLADALSRLGETIRVEEWRILVGTDLRFYPQRGADLTCFGAAEISAADDVVRVLAGLTEAEAAALARDHLGWQITEEGQEIPYASAVCTTVDLCPEILTWTSTITAAHYTHLPAR